MPKWIEMKLVKRIIGFAVARVFTVVVFLRNLFNGTDGLLGLSQLKSRHDTIERSF